MQIIIDGFSDLVRAEGKETLGEVFSWLNRYVKDNQRVITQVRLEGKTITEKERRRLEEKRVGEFEKLELVTSYPWQLAVGALDEIHQQLAGLAKNLKKVAFLFQTADYCPAFCLLRDCFKVWHWIIEGLQRVERILGLKYSLIFFKGKSLSEKVDYFLKFLKEANEAMEDHDFLLMAGLLEYELVPRIEEQAEMVKRISREIHHRLN